jgi:hypothetical protein
LTDEDKLSIAQGRASRAQNLLNDDMLTEAFKTLEEAYTQAWRSTLVEDVGAREKLFLAVNIVGKVRDHLEKVLMNGKLAAAELKQIAETAERKKRFGIIG